MKTRVLYCCVVILLTFWSTPLYPQNDGNKSKEKSEESTRPPGVQKAPERSQGEGPWNQLIIRGVTLINGNGSPPHRSNGHRRGKQYHQGHPCGGVSRS